MRGRRSRLHDFKDAKGETIGYPILIAITGLTQSAIQNRLRVYEEPPTDVQSFVKNALEFRTQSEFSQAIKGAEFTHEQTQETEKKSIKSQLDAIDLKIKEEKLRQAIFENEKREGKYARLIDVQLSVDRYLIALKTNLEALPERIVSQIRVCREDHEGIEILLEAIRNLTIDFANRPIKIRPSDSEDE